MKTHPWSHPWPQYISTRQAVTLYNTVSNGHFESSDTEPCVQAVYTWIMPTRVTGNSARDTKGKLVGEKRKRSSYTVTQSVFLQQELGKDNLDTKEDRQSVSDIFTKETGEKFYVQRIKTWHLNHKSNLQPKWVGRVGRSRSPFSHGEIFLPNDDDILLHKVWHKVCSEM